MILHCRRIGTVVGSRYITKLKITIWRKSPNKIIYKARAIIIIYIIKRKNRDGGLNSCRTSNTLSPGSTRWIWELFCPFYSSWILFYTGLPKVVFVILLNI